MPIFIKDLIKINLSFTSKSYHGRWVLFNLIICIEKELFNEEITIFQKYNI